MKPSLAHTLCTILRTASSYARWWLRFALVEILIISIVVLPSVPARGGFADSNGDFTIRVDAGRVSHGFSLEAYNSGTDSYYSVGGASAVLAAPGAAITGNYLGSESGLIIRDTTTNEHAPLPEGSNGIVSIPAGGWLDSAGGSGINRVYFVHYYARQGHQFAVQHQNINVTYLASGSEYIDGTHLGASAQVAPGESFRIVDLTTGERCEENVTFTSGAQWEPNPMPPPVASVTILIDSHQTGYNFTVHSLVPDGFEMLQTATAGRVSGGQSDGTYFPSFDGGTIICDPPTGITVSIGMGTTFWVTRNADGADPQTNGNSRFAVSYQDVAQDRPLNWSLMGQFQPVPTEPMTFSVAASIVDGFTWDGSHPIAGSPLGILQSSSLVPLTRDLGQPVASFPDLDEDGNPHDFYYYNLTANVNPNEPYWIVDYYGTLLTTNQSVHTAYGGWTAIHGPRVKTDLLQIVIPESRYAGSMILFRGYVEGTTQNRGLLSFSTVAGTISDPWTGAERDVLNHWTEGNFTYEDTDPKGWFLLDDSDGDHIQIQPGNNDLSTWWMDPEPKGVSISVTRWSHRLTIRCEDGSEFPFPNTARTFTHGEITTVLNEDSIWINPHYYFRGNSHYRRGLNWFVWDDTTQEAAPANTENLINWIALRPPRSLVAIAATNGNVSLNWTGASTAAAYVVERKSGGSWLRLARIVAVPGASACSYVDSTAAQGNNIYRTKSVFGDAISVPSNEASVNVINGSAVAISFIPPSWERDGLDGLFVHPGATFNPRIPAIRQESVVRDGGGSDLLIPTGEQFPSIPEFMLSPIERIRISGNRSIAYIRPDEVRITAFPLDRNDFVVVQRKTGWTGNWEDVNTFDMQHLQFDDACEVGPCYFYRAKAVNAKGSSPWSRMERWIPPLERVCRSVSRTISVYGGVITPPSPSVLPIIPSSYKTVGISQVAPVRGGEVDPARSLYTMPDFGLAANGTTSDAVYSLFEESRAGYWSESAGDQAHQFKLCDVNHLAADFISVSTSRARVTRLRYSIFKSIEKFEDLSHLIYYTKQVDHEFSEHTLAFTTGGLAALTVEPKSYTGSAPVPGQTWISYLYFNSSPRIIFSDSLKGSSFGDLSRDDRCAKDVDATLVYIRGNAGKESATQVALGLENCDLIDGDWRHDLKSRVRLTVTDSSKWKVLMDSHLMDSQNRTIPPVVVTNGSDISRLLRDRLASNPNWDGETPRLYVVPLSGARDGDSVKVGFTVSQDDFTETNELNTNNHSVSKVGSIGDEVTVVLQDDYERTTYEVPEDEASSPRYRRVSLSGRPISDEFPEQQAENDHPLNGSYVDALTLQLHHEVADLKLGVPGSSLALMVSRRLSETIWSSKNGGHPSKLLFQPFGPCWSSSLGMHIKIVCNPGELMKAFVTDYAGGVHCFLSAGGTGFGAIKYHGLPHINELQPLPPLATHGFFPAPTARHETEAQATRLSAELMPGGAVRLYFYEKYGTFTEFEHVEGTVVDAGGSSLGDPTQYFRPVRMVDVAGNQLNFLYQTARSPIPKRIESEQDPSFAVNIQCDTSNRVTSIWDPNGNLTTYQYAVVPGSDDGAISALSRIVYSGRLGMEFGYGVTSEVDTHPQHDGTGTYHHLNLTLLNDGNGNTYAFRYRRDQSKTGMNSEDGEFVLSGVPMNLETVLLPGTHAPVRFYNDSLVSFALNGGDWGDVSHLGIRRTRVKDLTGFQTTYDFQDPEVRFLFKDDFGAGSLEVSDLGGPNRTLFGTQSSGAYNHPELVLLYKSLQVTHGQFGSERFEFNPDAGLALSKHIDMNAKETKYRYYEPNRIRNVTFLEGAADFGISLQTPTVKEDTLGNKEFYFYNWANEKIGVLDANGTITATDNVHNVQNFGRGNHSETAVLPTKKRKWVIAKPGPAVEEYFSHSESKQWMFLMIDYPYANVNWAQYYASEPSDVQVACDYAAASGRLGSDLAGNTVLFKESYKYSVGPFPGVVDRVTVHKSANDPAWASDIVTNRELNSHGRVAIEETGGVESEFTYDRNGNRTSVMDRNGNRTSFWFDHRNRVTKVLFPTVMGSLGVKKTFEFDNVGNKILETDELGRATNYEYDQRNRIETVTKAGVTTHQTYTLLGQVETVTDARGKMTKNYYDDLMRLVRVENAKGSLDVRNTDYSYEGNEGGSAIDGTFVPTSITDARGYITKFVYDDLYRKVRTHTAFSSDHPTPNTALSSQAGVAVTRTEYDAVGNPIFTYDALGNATHVNYDGLNRPYLTTYPDGTTSEVFYTMTSLKWKVRDEQFRETETEFDAMGRVVQVLGHVLLDGSRAESQTVYDAAGNVSQSLVRRSDAAFARTSYFYDARNRKIETHSAGGTVSRAAYDAVGNLVASEDYRGKTTFTDYDALNRPWRVRNPSVMALRSIHLEPLLKSGQATTTYDDNGNVLTMTDAEGRTTTNVYDSHNRLTQTTDHAQIVTDYTYDGAGNRLTVKDGKSQVTTFTYDGLNRVLTNTPTVGAALVNEYNGVNLVQRTDPNGNLTHYRYDLRNRLKEVFYGATATGTPARAYSYDYVGNLTGVGDHSMAGSNSGAVTNASYTYDAMNRVSTETSNGLTHEYFYDLAGNRTKVLYAGYLGGTRRLVASEYDALGRVRTISEGMEGDMGDLDDDGVEEQLYSRVTQYFYDGNGNVIKKILPNADVVETSYDALNRSRVRLSTNGGVLQNRFEQWYDLTGNVRRIDETYGSPLAYSAGFGDRRLDLEYDGANRLLWEKVKTKTGAGAFTVAAGATEYQYDTANNRTWKKSYSGSNTTVPTQKWEGVFNSRNQLTNYRHWPAGGSSFENQILFTYDQNGNRVWQDLVWPGVSGYIGTNYSYDWENRLVTVEHWNDGDWRTEAYGYDYRTRRVSRRAWAGPMVDHDSNLATPKVADPATETENRKIVFSGGTSVREIAGSSPMGNAVTNASMEYVRGSDWGGGVGGILYTIRADGTATGELRFDHYNGRGDVVSQTDGAGATQWEAAYEAYGKRVREVGTTKDRQKANTKDEDPTGLLNEGMRYRDLETGVWLSRDPAGFVDGPNLYAYVTQNPWSKFDPDGLEEKYGWQTVEHRRNFNNFYEPLTGNHGYATQITRAREWVEPPQDDYGAIANLGMEGLRSGLAQQFGKATKMAETVRNLDLESLKTIVEGVAGSMNPLEKASSALDAATAALGTAESAMNAPAGHRGGIAYAAGKKSAGPLVGMVAGKLLEKGGTYMLKSPDSGQVRRTGKTNDLKRREGEHKRGKETKDLDFEVDRRSDNEAARRGREDRIYDDHPEADLNKKRPIDPNNPKRDYYHKEGDKL